MALFGGLVMAHWAKPGVKCVCIDGGSPNSDGARLLGRWPITGQVYTVDGFSIDEYYGVVLLHLAEIPCAEQVRGVLRGWNAARFRPLITRTQEQDVSLFAHLLEPVRAAA